jgi:hypothetical protein
MPAALPKITLGEAMARWRGGSMTDREYRRYYRAWCWSAPRFGYDGGRQQDQLGVARGQSAVDARIDRVRRATGLFPYRR